MWDHGRGLQQHQADSTAFRMKLPASRHGPRQRSGTTRRGARLHHDALIVDVSSGQSRFVPALGSCQLEERGVAASGYLATDNTVIPALPQKNLRHRRAKTSRATPLRRRHRHRQSTCSAQFPLAYFLGTAQIQLGTRQLPIATRIVAARVGRGRADTPIRRRTRSHCLRNRASQPTQLSVGRTCQNRQGPISRFHARESRVEASAPPPIFDHNGHAASRSFLTWALTNLLVLQHFSIFAVIIRYAAA